MTREHNGVAARLRRINRVMLNFHCLYHKLAVGCANAGGSVNYIMEVEKLLKETWKFFENTPKRTRIFMKVQGKVHYLTLTDRARKLKGKLAELVGCPWSRVLTACLRPTLDCSTLLKSLVEKMKTVKFVGTSYILEEVLPCLST